MWPIHRVGLFGCLVAAFMLGAVQRATAASLDPAVLPQIQAATFEVVIPKPASDPLQYEKPLPLDQLPFQFRNDKYFSIGTAFAIGHGRYVTAAHVLNGAIGSRLGAPAVRDTRGHVYAIDKILKFSLAQDFVVFSLLGQPSTASLPIDTAPVLNQAVYAVGNALGTGVVIRDGLYTSDTPEEKDGRWKWMRFSAAASPGNSGGPLLDKDGKLIGVVLMKSPGENLNYALPIALVLSAPEQVATFDRRQSYQFDIFDATLSGDFKAQFALPKTFAEFDTAYLKLANAYADQQLHALLAKEADNLFPRGDGSHQLLSGRAYLDAFPSLIVRNGNGVWGLSNTSQNRSTLDHNGFVEQTEVGHQVLLHLRRPDNIPAARFYSDPALLMDLQLKGSPFYRTVASDKVRVTSLGTPSESSLYTDQYQRIWQVHAWPLDYCNSVVISFSLPVPDGYVSMVRLAAAGEQKHSATIDLKALTDFLYVSYDGTLAQWKEYLQDTALLPGAFSNLHIAFDYGKRFSYRSQRMDLSYAPSLQKIEPDSELTLGMDYFRDQGKVVWDVASIEVKANAHDPELVRVNRRVKPFADVDDSYQSNWKQMLRREHPVDGVVFTESDVSYINRIADPQGGHQADPAMLYTALYGAKGTQQQKAMGGKLDLLLSQLKVTEH
jgi:hypothetical protein